MSYENNHAIALTILSEAVQIPQHMQDSEMILKIVNILGRMTPESEHCGTQSRVKFLFTVNEDQAGSPHAMEMFKKTLGLRRDEIRAGQPRWLIVRPSQFARFLIGRNDLGMKNGFRELMPVLFVAEGEERPPIDLTRRSSFYTSPER